MWPWPHEKNLTLTAKAKVLYAQTDGLLFGTSQKNFKNFLMKKN